MSDTDAYVRDPKEADTVRVTASTGVRTNMATLYVVLAATALLAGGIVSIKRDISDIADTQREKSQEMRDLRDDVNKIMFHLFSSTTGKKP